MALREIEMEQRTSGYLGVLRDYSRLSHKEVLEEYLKLKKRDYESLECGSVESVTMRMMMIL